MAYPMIERACMLEISRPRNGRPSYVWVQGWKVRYSADRESMPLRLADARVLLAETRAKVQPVVFRAFPEGDVIALFCNSGKDCNPGNVTSYMHVGQHGEASRHLGRSLRLASADEYAPLLREIQSIYSDSIIQPVKRLKV